MWARTVVVKEQPGGEAGISPLPPGEQVTGRGEGTVATADLRVNPAALRPFIVAPAQTTWGRGFPLFWCLMNSFRI
jgi:hypothetical protein